MIPTRNLMLACALTFLAPAAIAQPFEMKLGFATINDSQHEVAKLFAAEMDKKTNGAIQVKIFPAAQLGSIVRQFEGLQLGTQEAVFSPGGFIVGVNPALQVADAVGMFDSVWHQHKAMNHPTVRDKFLSLAEPSGIKGTFLWGAGNTGIATRMPVKRLADLKGLKIRVLASKMETAFIGALEATGAPMEFSEVLPAIQQRTLDGVRTGLIVLAPSKFYSVAKHFYAEPTGHIATAMWVSRAWFGKLPANLQAAVVEVGQALADPACLIALDINNRAYKMWTDNGGEINEPTPEDRAIIVARARALADEFLGSDARVKDMYALVKQAAEATRGEKPPR